MTNKNYDGLEGDEASSQRKKRSYTHRRK